MFGRAVTLEAFGARPLGPLGGGRAFGIKVLSCTVPCGRQLWTLCMILSVLYMPELCFVE